MKEPLRVGSTFSGVGGADIGLERAGFQLAWTCEWDEWKRSILAAHWPDVPHYTDVRDLARGVGDKHELQQSGSDGVPRAVGAADDSAAFCGSVDLLVGGFPCQDLSVAGKRRGFEGERSVLAFEFLRIAESLRPRWILMENVPGLLSSNGGRDLARLLDEVGTIGYGWAYRILDARYWGVPQRRRRIFICARRADAEFDSGAAAGLALRALWEGSSGDPTPGWPPREILAAGAGGGTPSGRVVAFGHTQGLDPQASWSAPPTLRKNGGGHGVAYRKSKRAASDQDDETWVADDAANTLNAFDAGDTRTTHAVVNTASTLQASAGKGAGWRIDAEGAAGGHLVPMSQAYSIREDDKNNTFSATPIDAARCLQAHQPSVQSHHAQTFIAQTFPINDGRPVEKFSNGTGIGEDGAPAYTLDRQQQPAVAIPEQMSVRRLTPIECERLMGWPDNWTAPPGVKAPDSKRYAACGDGIVSWVAYWIGCRIQMIEDES